MRKIIVGARDEGAGRGQRSKDCSKYAVGDVCAKSIDTFSAMFRANGAAVANTTAKRSESSSSNGT